MSIAFRSRVVLEALTHTSKMFMEQIKNGVRSVDDDHDDDDHHDGFELFAHMVCANNKLAPKPSGKKKQKQ